MNHYHQYDHIHDFGLYLIKIQEVTLSYIHSFFSILYEPEKLLY